MIFIVKTFPGFNGRKLLVKKLKRYTEISHGNMTDFKLFRDVKTITFKVLVVGD